MKKVTVSIEDFKSLNIFKFITDEKIRGQVIDIIEAVAPFLNAINGEFREYTLHDLGHSYRVAKYMDQIALGIKPETIESHKSSFSDFEYALMIISAVLHDIGMHYTEEDENRSVSSYPMMFYVHLIIMMTMLLLEKKNYMK